MKRVRLRFSLTPTQRAYAYSTAVVNLIYSNTGEGKTYASVVSMLIHAQRCGRPIRCAIVRDTHENIKTSTARSIMEMFEATPWIYRFRNDFKQLTIFTNPQVDVDLFGIDDPASLSKLQGPEYALIWLEEPAPMTDKANAGLSEEVFNAALVRATRQKNTLARLQISMNPADQDHWTFKRLIEPEFIDPDEPEITKAIFRIEPGENFHVNPISRAAVRAAYRDDQASFMRYALGQFAPVYRGKKVTPEFNPALHVAAEPLEPAPGLVSFRVWDSWHNPCCLIGQITTIGRLIFIDEIKLENADIRTLIEAHVKPLMNSPRWKGKIRAWRDIGDFTMKVPDQSNKQESAARVVEDAFGTIFEHGPIKWEIMKNGMKKALNMNIEGLPAVLVNPSCRQLIKSLSGAWHYKTDNSGNIISNIPEKDEASHVGDCFANGVSVLLPGFDYKKNVMTYRRIAQQNRRRVQTYAIGGAR